MTEPTPRPWEVKDGHMLVEPGLMESVADCALSDYENEPFDAVMARAKANAELIVRCVNAYDDLVAGLEKVIDFGHQAMQKNTRDEQLIGIAIMQAVAEGALARNGCVS